MSKALATISTPSTSNAPENAGIILRQKLGAITQFPWTTGVPLHDGPMVEFLRVGLQDKNPAADQEALILVSSCPYWEHVLIFPYVGNC